MCDIMRARRMASGASTAKPISTFPNGPEYAHTTQSFGCAYEPLGEGEDQ